MSSVLNRHIDNMYSIWKFFLEKRQFSYLLLIALIAGGFFSLVSIPKESAPEVQIPVGIVTTVLPGASAQDVELLVTNKIEQSLKGTLEDVKKITSVSGESLSVVTVEFVASADIDASIRQLKDKVDAAVPKLPNEAETPIVSEINFANQPITTFALFGDRSAEELSDIAEALEDDLLQVSGVSDVVIVGARNREVRVVVRPEALAAYNLSTFDVISGIRAGNAALPVGTLEVGGIRYPVEFEGDIVDPKEIASIPIASVGGAPVYVRDVADVFVGLAQENSRSRVSVGGEPSLPAITVNVFKRQGGNILSINKNVLDRIEVLQQEGKLLDGLTFLTIYSAADEIGNDLRKLTKTGLETIALVMLTLFITVGWREALVAGISIPISFLIAFIGLDASGNTINFVSLFSLILAVGVLVDAAVVIVEGMYTYIVQGKSRFEAALLAVKTYHQPLSIGILTTVAVFVPLFFISGVVGEFIATIPFTLIFVLLASLFVALVFVPIIGISTLSNHAAHETPTWQDALTAKLQKWYRAFLGRVLDSKRLRTQIRWGLVTLFFVSLFFPALGLVKVIFFPGEDANFVLVDIELAQGAPLEETDMILRQLEEMLYEIPDVASFSVTVGSSNSFSQDVQNGSRFGNIFVNLSETRERTSGEFVVYLREMMKDIIGAEIRISEPESGPPVGTPVVIKFIGDDLEELKRTAGEAATILSSIEGTANVRAGDTNDMLSLVITIDRARARQLGVDAVTVAQTLRTAVSGVNATTVRANGTDIDVSVVSALMPQYQDPFKTNVANVDALLQLRIPTRDGSVVLGTFASAHIGTAVASIVHENGNRVVTASSELAPSGTTRDVVAEFSRRAAAELSLPEEVSMVIGGENEETDRSFMEMFYALIAGIVLMLVVLMFEFNSFRHSLYVLACVPLTLIGIMVGLAATQLPLSFPSLLGFIALAGIIVNHTILLIDIVNHLRRAHPEWSIRDVVIEGSVRRLRPITLTNITTVIGMIPLALSGGIWAPLAIAIMFGLAFAGVITLLLIPILYVEKPGTLYEQIHSS